MIKTIKAPISIISICALLLALTGCSLITRVPEANPLTTGEILEIETFTGEIEENIINEEEVEENIIEEEDEIIEDSDTTTGTIQTGNIIEDETLTGDINIQTGDIQTKTGNTQINTGTNEEETTTPEVSTGSKATTGTNK